MPELDTDLTRAVEALRSARSPDAGAQARVHARLEAILLAPGGGGGDGGGDGDLGGGDGLAELGSSLGGSGQAAGAGAGGAGIAFAAKVVGATASLTAAGLLTLKLGAMAIGGLSSGPASEPAPTITPVAAVDSSGERADPPAVAASAVEPEPPTSVEDPAPGASTSEAAPASKPGKPAAAVAPEPAPTDASDIQAELAHIDAARRATSPSQAITQLRAHAEAFPDGALRDERDALWAIASCELDQLDDARRRTAALAERRPSSPLLERIAKACPSLEP